MNKTKNIVLSALVAAFLTPVALLGGPYESKATAFMENYRTKTTWDGYNDICAANDALRTNIQSAVSNGESLSSDEAQAWRVLYLYNVVSENTRGWVDSLAASEESVLETMDDISQEASANVAYALKHHYFRTPTELANADMEKMTGKIAMRVLRDADYPDAATRETAYSNYIDTVAGTGWAFREWRNFFSEYRSGLDTLQAKIDLTKTELDGLRQVGDRNDAQDAWMDTLMRDLVSYKMEQ